MKTQCIQNSTLAAALAVVAVLAIPDSVRAQLITTDPSLPPLYPPAFYTNLAGVGPIFHGPGLTVVIQNEQHRPLGPVVRTTIGPDEREDFSSSFLGLISANGGPLSSATASGPVTTEVFGKVGNTTGTFATEMLSMNLTGSSPLYGPFMIRESPTLASTGQTTITSLGGGQYRIDSFFDVFTELSVDGGQSWIPSDSSTHMVLMPEPSAAGLLALGLLAWRGLRTRRAHQSR